jgi:hypothetical protein
VHGKRAGLRWTAAEEKKGEGGGPCRKKRSKRVLDNSKAFLFPRIDSNSNSNEFYFNLKPKHSINLK